MSRWLRTGAFVCLVIAIINTVVHGFVLDEAAVPAQIISGQVEYPDGHPQRVFYRGVYTVQNYSAAWFLQAWPSVEALSAVRNVGLVFLSLFAPFAVTVILTGSPLWACVATVLVMTEAIVRVGGVYPIWVYPHFYGHGHFGLQVSIIGAVLLVGGYHRFASLIIGLIPSLHAAMAVVTWPWAAVYAWCSRRTRTSRQMIGAIVAVGVGIAACGGLAIYIRQFTANDHIVPPYNAVGSADVIYSQFSKYNDGHRKLLPFWTLPYFGALVIYLCIGCLLLSRPRQISAANASIRRWMFLFGLGAWVLVLVAGAWHYVAGSLPYRLNQLMPYRFCNLPNTLLIPMTVTVIADAHRRLQGSARVAVSLLVGAMLVGATICIPIHRAHTCTHLLPIAWGMMLVAVGFADASEGRGWFANRIITLTVLAVLTILAFMDETSAVWSFSVSGAVSAAILSLAQSNRSLAFLAGARWSVFARTGLIVSCFLAASSSVAFSKVRDRSDPWHKTTADDRLIATWLKDHAQPNEMILPPLAPRIELQPKTGHPVVMELETLWFMAYDRSICPTVGMMSRELYGIDYSDPAQIESLLTDGKLVLKDITRATWSKRTLPQWRELMDKYGFRLVVAPVDLALPLTRVLTGQNWALYEIPSGSS